MTKARLCGAALIVAMVLIACPASALRPGLGPEVANPLRGPIAWQVILCQFTDSAALAKKHGISPQPLGDVQYYRDLFFTSGTQGLHDWVHAASYGLASVSGSVHGWYTEPQTWEQAQAASRGRHLSDCVAAAASPPTGRGYPKQPAAYVPPVNDRVYVITSPGIDLVGFDNRGAVGSDWWINKDGTTKPHTEMREITHEFGHGLGLAHSFSNDLTAKTTGAPGSYGNSWDIMSDASAFVPTTIRFGHGPALLDAHHLDELGWVPMNRIINVGEDGVASRSVRLAALTHPSADGYLLARVLFDEKDRFHYYTVEYRVADGLDSAMTHGGTYPSKMIQINEVAWEANYDPGTGHALYVTFLQRELGKYAGTDRGPPVQSLDSNGVTIAVTEAASDHAVVEITTKFRPECKSGFVWRMAGPTDYTCVPPASRSQALVENREASRYASDGKCARRYVLRDAFRGDKVCVDEARAYQTHQDNVVAYSRAKWQEYGPLTCKAGYVWRHADESDYVCVTEAIRDQTAADNAASASHALGGRCKHPYVPRDAFPGDRVCATVGARLQARADDDAALSRVQKPNS